ncbi:MAG TPA: RHS repeat-associated core domain-containing protein, partial [Solirubrobacteraceae bacterium]|nr:RHS repeat-associated core domain-containing protein [Solirubrobacteraceae bacterium]
ITYSDGKTPTVKYEYNGDGDRTKMIDGSGESTYTYDQLDRLEETKDGHGETIKYEYNLDNQPTTITYPNGKAVSRTYDEDDRLETVKDWLENTTSFAYDPDSNLEKITYPSGSGDTDTYAYEDDDAIEEVKFKQGTEKLASLVYTRNKDGEVTKVTSKDLPGEEKPAYSYDEDDRLTKGAGIAYAYDAANNPTTIEKTTLAYNAGDELEDATNSKKATVDTYNYDEVGERTKTTPAAGPATSYGWDQAGDLITVERPKEGETPKIEDTYAYNGENLRASETISGTTNYLTWDTAEPELPLILSNGTSSFIYGPSGMPIEQINNSTNAVQYLHHDQAGSTRLITGETGKVEGRCSYSPYGTPDCEGTASTPLGYDGQYTSSDTGLVYLRNRVYDPSTAQFLSVDPAVPITRAPYTYGQDNPLNREDPTGLSAEGIGDGGVPCIWPFCAPPPGAEEGARALGKGIAEGANDVYEGAKHGVESVVSWITGESESSNENAQSGASEGECGEVTFGHGGRHLEGTGLSQEEVERAIEDQVNGGAGRGNEYGPFGGRVIVDGKTIEYRGYGLGGGNVNIGTYYPVP